jgi:outer membrane protein assembly factor BamE (lipoprotein component of BamABCDE complex)
MSLDSAPEIRRGFLQFSLRTLLVVMAVCAVLCAVGVTLYNSLPNDVTRAEIDQLRPGMTKDEVQAILGKPDDIDQTQIYGQAGERWNYGIWGWMIFFVDDSFVHAELF